MMGLSDPGSSSVKDKDSGDVGRFLNRILGLSVERQNMVQRNSVHPSHPSFFFQFISSVFLSLSCFFPVFLVFCRVHEGSH